MLCQPHYQAPSCGLGVILQPLNVHNAMTCANVGVSCFLGGFGMIFGWQPLSGHRIVCHGTGRQVVMPARFRRTTMSESCSERDYLLGGSIRWRCEGVNQRGQFAVGTDVPAVERATGRGRQAYRKGQ